MCWPGVSRVSLRGVLWTLMALVMAQGRQA